MELQQLSSDRLSLDRSQWYAGSNGGSSTRFVGTVFAASFAIRGSAIAEGVIARASISNVFAPLAWSQK
ncbi:hypothetical protein Pla100_26010 [Neorhodopirellula pilleata]|uniref:Uncharacterized protein n=1 Tax=Neorhodopirellula pilleata TaxID=2714738 RepID=A0A5C6ADF9_9BACT|nr:hypothetical protein Pla100_26010 [Neorhodopirellula pilleata]